MIGKQDSSIPLIHASAYDHINKSNNVSDFQNLYGRDYYYYSLMLALQCDADYIVFNEVPNIDNSLNSRIQDLNDSGHSAIFYNCNLDLPFLDKSYLPKMSKKASPNRAGMNCAS